jgi:hypothetical protein
VCQGLIFESVQTVKDLMATATTRTGLKLLKTIVYNTYQTGQKVAVDFKSNLKIVFDKFLPQWNYTPKPQLQVISSTILTCSLCSLTVTPCAFKVVAMPYIHILLEYPPKLSISQIVNSLKGLSSPASDIFSGLHLSYKLSCTHWALINSVILAVILNYVK